ncbi:MAG: hypothetical protein KME54_02860 [Tolypothrix brevis GSE-NOS-MK-07-07A]|jgi:hypothetical protein|nr:hypothetical protein [Tolypothrix brevis GSE-NOS-MK-07-07A]
MNATLLHLSIVAGVVAWSLLFWVNWDWLRAGGHKRIFTYGGRFRHAQPAKPKKLLPTANVTVFTAN